MKRQVALMLTLGIAVGQLAAQSPLGNPLSGLETLKNFDALAARLPAYARPPGFDLPFTRISFV